MVLFKILIMMNKLVYLLLLVLAQIIINRPSKLNALNKVTIQELHDAFENLEKDENVRVIIITGEGEKAFVAGADISEFANFSIEEGAQLAAQGQEILFDFVEKLKTPVIAAVNGFALGGGLELAMAGSPRAPRGATRPRCCACGRA